MSSHFFFKKNVNVNTVPGVTELVTQRISFEKKRKKSWREILRSLLLLCGGKLDFSVGFKIKFFFLQVHVYVE